MTALPLSDIMLAAAIVFGLATACQVVAPRLHVPGLILLLPVGFLLGLLAPQFRVDQILGPVFPAVVDLIVALILFQGGMELSSLKLRGKDRTVVIRLIWIGAPLTWIGASLATHFIIGLSWGLSFLLGAILIVSGPTVVTPILDFARPNARVRGILLWEGTSLDPLGAIFAVVVFQVVRVSNLDSPIDALGTFVWSFVVAFGMAIVGVLLAVLGSKLARGNAVLATQSLVGSVIVAVGVADFLAQDSGLLTALLMGTATIPVAKRLHGSIEPTIPFFNTIAAIGIGVLFVSIAAMVPSPVVLAVTLPAIGVAVVLILVVRPIVAGICTSGAGLTTQERAFIGWMDPRGIVAAATASSVGAALVVANVDGADELLPAAFVIIAVTVFVYALTAAPVAAALGVRQPSPVEGGTFAP